MDNLTNEIRREMNVLHFSKALTLLASIDDKDKTAADWLLTGICHAAIYDWNQARDDYLKALSLSPSPLLANRIRLRLVYLFTQTGVLDQAQKWYDQIDLPEADGKELSQEQAEAAGDYLFYGALLAYEKSELDRALSLALKLAEKGDPTLGKIRCEAWTLAGDLYSAKGELRKALDCYGQSLRLLPSLPESWRELRKALILNNLADVYEQFECYREAAGVYSQAWKCVMATQDDQIFDLSGYKLEILLSMANFYALKDDLDQAKELLAHARPLAETIELPLQLYWKSRIDYIGGLCELYSENPKYNPFAKLFEAWQLQTRYLSVSPASCREYLARTAYYAAYCYDEKIAGNVSQKELYDQALHEFELCYFKDPKFFLFCIASVQNELGNLASKTDPNSAFKLYSRAAKSYETYLKRWPEDQLAQTSLLAVLLNLFGVMNEMQLKENGIRMLTLFEMVARYLMRDVEGRPQAQEAIIRLLDDDRLYALYPKRLEKIHDLLQNQVLH